MNTNTLLQFLPIVILAVFVYFVLIRPQSKQQKQVKDMLGSMKVGDEVMTAGGFYGIVFAIDDENVVLEMLPDFNKAMIRKASIVKVITADDVEEIEDVPEELDEVAEDTKVEDADFEEVKDEETKEDK
ncbi:MAG: preprotein translocase subunit YajC [Eubacterium aggregans]|jgi:preprotein translocase subunit YajC|uniref:preprotein translocase subunit YajC n=1 Tax=Eubacterium TaxID=1730 RepID=UPI002B1ED8D8|nr:preprotein translocase subunit YajC [Eubacterium aggregans]MEA5074229.1 preprotein translocase subunit YajC [Eubacterium aggregans]